MPDLSSWPTAALETLLMYDCNEEDGYIFAEYRDAAQVALDTRREAARREQERYQREVGFLRVGQQCNDAGESWVDWMIFPPHMSDEEILDRSGWSEFGTGVNWTPSGFTFGRGPRIRRTRTRVLLTQRCGLDI